MERKAAFGWKATGWLAVLGVAVLAVAQGSDENCDATVPAFLPACLLLLDCSLSSVLRFLCLAPPQLWSHAPWISLENDLCSRDWLLGAGSSGRRRTCG